MRVRIAPSPTGDPHIGTAYTALFNFAYAKKNKGEFILRIEDTDQARLVAGSEEKIYEALDWLGLSVDESPKSVGKFQPYKQSERLKIYEEYVKELLKKEAAYYCDCSPDRLKKVREEQQARGEVPHYDGKCRTNPPKGKENLVVRLKVPREGETFFEDKIRGKITFKNKDIDDQVLLKSDGFPTYHLASVVDDHLMEVTHVIRGEEWLSSTPKHVILYQAFGWQNPEFAHLPLLRNADRSKLSKRKNPVSILWYRDQGYLPQALLNFLALMGWSMPGEKEIFSLREFTDKFDFSRVDPAGPIFDIQKLDWMNGEYIRSMPDVEFVKILKKYSKRTEAEIKGILPLVRERIKKLSEFDSITVYFFEDIKVSPDLIIQKKKTSSETKKVLDETSAILKNAQWESSAIEKELRGYQQNIRWSGTDLFQTIRIAVTGSKASPPLFETLEAIGKEKVLDRMKLASDSLSN